MDDCSHLSSPIHLSICLHQLRDNKLTLCIANQFSNKVIAEIQVCNATHNQLPNSAVGNRCKYKAVNPNGTHAVNEYPTQSYRKNCQRNSQQCNDVEKLYTLNSRVETIEKHAWCVQHKRGLFAVARCATGHRLLSSHIEFFSRFLLTCRRRKLNQNRSSLAITNIFYLALQSLLGQSHYDHFYSK